ncbi:MAG: helix-turn-helix transcriptional regulator [Vulcanimicrobiota bacterium]
MKVWQPIWLPGVSLRETTALQERELPCHVHHSDIFTLALSGGGEITDVISGKTFLVEEGDCMVGHAGTALSGRIIGRSLSLVLPGRASRSRQALQRRTEHSVRDEVLVARFLELFGGLTRADDLDQQLHLMEQLTSCLQDFELAGPCSAGPRVTPEQTEVLERVRAQIDERPGRKLTLEELARQVSWHPHHLQKLFRARYGLSPGRYQNQLRLEQAVRLLREQRAAAEVALEVGFTDQSHLIRAFRRWHGCTPAAYMSSLSNPSGGWVE